MRILWLVGQGATRGFGDGEEGREQWLGLGRAMGAGGEGEEGVRPRVCNWASKRRYGMGGSGKARLLQLPAFGHNGAGREIKWRGAFRVILELPPSPMPGAPLPQIRQGPSRTGLREAGGRVEQPPTPTALWA